MVVLGYEWAPTFSAPEVEGERMDLPRGRTARRLCSLSLLLVSVAIGCVVLLGASSAGAYCRTRTCEFSRRNPCTFDPATGCSREGSFAFWSDHCVPFAVQRDGSALDGISAATLEALVEDAFRAWSDVPCAGGNTPELAAASQGPIACDAVEYECAQRDANSNVIMFRDDFVDADYGLRFGVIALTTLTASTVTGEVFDADMEINTRDEDFVIDETASVEPGAPRDLRAVVTHEIGHLLGLSHSLEQGALMRAGYEGTLDPSQDDIAAICAALGARASNPNCNGVELGADAGCIGSDDSCRTLRRAPEPRGCSCRLAAGAKPGAFAESGPGGGGWLVAVGGVLLAHLRRSRRHRSML